MRKETKFSALKIFNRENKAQVIVERHVIGIIWWLRAKKIFFHFFETRIKSTIHGVVQVGILTLDMFFEQRTRHEPDLPESHARPAAPGRGEISRPQNFAN